MKKLNLTDTMFIFILILMLSLMTLILTANHKLRNDVDEANRVNIQLHESNHVCVEELMECLYN